MANLKEILPVALAAIGGVASPRGADVFNNMAQMMQQRQEAKIRDSRAEEQMRLAQLASDREAERLNIAKDEQKASASLREINMKRDQEDYDRKTQERKGVDAYKAQAIAALDPEDPETMERTLAISGAKSVKEVQDMQERYGIPTLEERIKAAEATGLDYRFEQDGVTYQGGGKKEIPVGSPTNKTILDMMDDGAYKSDFGALSKLDAEAAVIGSQVGRPRVQKEDGTFEEGPIEQLARINAQKKLYVKRLLKRAMLLSNGDQAAFADQAQEIYGMSGMPEKEFMALLGQDEKKEAAGGGAAAEPFDADAFAEQFANGVLPAPAATVTPPPTDQEIQALGSEQGAITAIQNTLRGMFGSN